VTAWLVPSTGEKIPLAENRFLQAGKGSENTNEKSRRCFMYTENSMYRPVCPVR